LLNYKFCQNFKNTSNFFRKKKKEKKNYKDLCVGQNLMEFAKLFMLESLKKKKIIIFLKAKHRSILEIVIEFNEKL